MTGDSPASPAAVLPDPAAVRGSRWSWIKTNALSVALSGTIFVALAAMVATDPPHGVTWSNAPFTDEAWNVVNARNLVLIGAWSTDDWTHHLLTLPFSMAEAVAFATAGVGIVQARFVSIVAVALTTGLLSWSLRRVLGPLPALVAALAFASSALVLYYGRLAFLEPVETLFLVATAATIPRATGERAGRAGLMGGAMLALAIATKTNAVFVIAGLLTGLSIAGFRSPNVRRWLIVAVVVIVATGAAYLVAIWLPNRHSIGLMTNEWLRWATSPPHSPVDRIARYLANNDGAIGYLAPLWIGSAIALTATAIAWRRLPPEVRLLSIGGLGWVVVGWGILFLVTYNPNRYLVPVVPGFALIISVGAYAAIRLVPRRPALARIVLAVAAVAIVLPGVVWAETWSRSASATLPDLQERVHAIVPAGSVLEGSYAPLLAMRVPSVVLITDFRANPGDLYADRGVRWLVLEPAERPTWVASHADAWAARELMLTAPWGTTTLELYRLP